MADTRAIIEAISPQQIPWAGRLITQIDQALSVIHQVISTAYADGKDKPIGDDAQRLFLFEKFWQRIHYQNASLKTIDEIRAHYAKLEETMTDFFKESEARCVTENDKQLFIKLMQLIKEFALRRHILSCFKVNLSSSVIKRDLSDIMSLCELADTAFKNAQLEWLTQRARIVTESMQATLQKFVACGYLPENHRAFNREAARSALHVELEKLPLHAHLSQLTEESNRSRESESRDNEDHCRARLIHMLIVLRELRISFNHMYEGKLLSHDLLINELLARIQELSKLQETISKYENVNDVLGLLTLIQIKGENQDPLQVLALGIRNQCFDLQSAKYKLTFGIMNSPWKQAGELILNCCREVVLASAIFCNEYLCVGSAHENIQQRIITIDANKKLIVETHKQLALELAAAKNIWRECHATLFEIETILAGHLQADEEGTLEFIQKFLGDHWGKILIGGVGGAGASSVAAIIFALPAAAFALLVIGVATLGSSAGAGTGLALEYYRDKPKKKENSASKWLFWCKPEPTTKHDNIISLRPV